jgi:NADH-quinone oxidoreductase subunit N
MSPNFHDVFFIAPEIVLTVWGLVVLLVDLGVARRLTPTVRRRTIGWLALAGVGLALATAVLVCFVPLMVRAYPQDEHPWLSAREVLYFAEVDPVIFFGTLAGDVQSAFFNILYVALLGLIVGLSMSWSFTEEWGEYFALMFWATVGMMLLTASEELITLFLTLETMTICLYLSTAMEKTKRRSAEGGLKYFVYGSVSSALFLFGLSLVYGMTGTTSFEGIRKILADTGTTGLLDNVAGATAILLLMVGFGFKVAAVPFHQWAPDAYEGAPAPVTAWIATGSKLASFVALMKVFLHALLPWSSPTTSILGPGWIGIIAIISAVTMTYGNFAALAQKNFKRMLAYSSIAHAGYILVGVAAVSISMKGATAAGSVLYYLIVYAFANVGAFAVAGWLARDLDSDDIDDLNGLGYQEPLLATCILILMLSLIGIPPLAGFFGKLYVFMEALNQTEQSQKATLIWLVALGLMNSVVSAFYYVRVLKAMFLREPGTKRLAAPDRGIAIPIVIGTVVVVVFGLMPASLMSVMQAAAVPMLTSPPYVPPGDPAVMKGNPNAPKAQLAAPSTFYTPEQLVKMRTRPPAKGAAAKGKGAFAKGKGAAAKGKSAAAEGKGAAAEGKGAAPSAKGSTPNTSPTASPENKASTPAPTKNI